MALSSKSWDVETATELLLSNWTYSTMITTHAPLSRFPTPLTPPMSKLDSLPIWIKKHLDSPTQCIYESITSFSLSIWHYSLFLNSHIISNLRCPPPPSDLSVPFPQQYSVFLTFCHRHPLCPPHTDHVILITVLDVSISSPSSILHNHSSSFMWNPIFTMPVNQNKKHSNTTLTFDTHYTIAKDQDWNTHKKKQ